MSRSCSGTRGPSSARMTLREPHWQTFQEEAKPAMVPPDARLQPQPRAPTRPAPTRAVAGRTHHDFHAAAVPCQQCVALCLLGSLWGLPLLGGPRRFSRTQQSPWVLEPHPAPFPSRAPPGWAVEEGHRGHVTCRARRTVLPLHRLSRGPGREEGRHSRPPRGSGGRAGSPPPPPRTPDGPPSAGARPDAPSQRSRAAAGGRRLARAGVSHFGPSGRAPRASAGQWPPPTSLSEPSCFPHLLPPSGLGSAALPVPAGSATAQGLPLALRGRSRRGLCIPC